MEVERMKEMAEVQKEDKNHHENIIKRDIETKTKIEVSKIREFKVVGTIGSEA